MTHILTDFDIEMTCWWCGSLIRGFDIKTGRERHPYQEHFCDAQCKHAFDNCNILDE